MPRNYIKKEKKIINYKEGSFNSCVHPFFSLFEDLTKDLLEINASNKRLFENALTTLHKQGKVKRSKINIKGKVFRSYHYTQNFKNKLYEKEPKSYPQFGERNKRETNNDSLLRATKISDSMCMGMMAGLVYEPSKKMSFKALTNGSSKEEKKEGQNSNENGQSLSVNKSNLKQKYDDLSYSVNPNFIPNYDETIGNETLLKKGVMYARYEMGMISQISGDDVNHNNFTAMTGMLLTDERAFFLYHSGLGNTSWLTNGEAGQAVSLGLSLAGLFPRTTPLYSIKSSIIFLRNVNLVEEIVNGNQKGPVLHLPGKGFENAYIIPISKEGVCMLRWIAHHPSYCESIAILLKKEKGFVESNIAPGIFPVLREVDNTLYCVLIDLDIQKIREIIRGVREDDYEKVTVVCLKWQKKWLSRVLPDSIKYAPIKKDIVEKIVGNHIKSKDSI